MHESSIRKDPWSLHFWYEPHVPGEVKTNACQRSLGVGVILSLLSLVKLALVNLNGCSVPLQVRHGTVAIVHEPLWLEDQVMWKRRAATHVDWSEDSTCLES
jgi:hypothetical protein